VVSIIQLERSVDDSETRGPNRLASQGVQGILALEVEDGKAPRIPENLRRLIVGMVQDNPTWGEERVAAELSVKLGILVSPRTVRAYWPRESDPPIWEENFLAALADVCPQSRPGHRGR
jgi:hypothetical protein